MAADHTQKTPRIGYCRPPAHSRFQPGRSGNPAGRKKGTRNLRTDVRDTLGKPVAVNDKGTARNVSTQQAALLRLREKALNGDARALDRLLEYARLFNNDVETAEVGQSMTEEDQKILEAYAAEIRGHGATGDGGGGG